MRNCKKCGKTGTEEEFKTKFKCLDCYREYEHQKHIKRYIPRSKIIDPLQVEKNREKNAKIRERNKNRKRTPEQLEKFREYQRIYWRERRRKDPILRLTHSNRTRIRQALNGIYKSESSLVLIGCTTEQLKLHIESLFQEGMNWLNYGEWEVDHIRPCSSFDLNDPLMQKQCFHYTNLQPLWKKDNRLKSDKIN